MKKKRLAILISLFVCFFLSAIIMQLAVSAERTILNPDFYCSFVKEHRLDSIPQDFVLLTIKNNTRELDNEIYQSLIKASSATFPQHWAQEQFDGVINNFLAYLKNDIDQLDLKIDCKEQKKLFITQILAFLPQTAEDGVIDHLIKANMAEHLGKSIGIPDYLDLQSIAMIQDSILPYIDIGRTYYPYSKYIPFLLLAFFFLCMRFLFHPSDTIKYSGYILFASGLLLIVFISCISGVLDKSITAKLSSYDALLALTGNNPKILAVIFKNSVLNSIKQIAIIFCLGGIVSSIVGTIAGKTKRSWGRISPGS